MKNFSTSTIAAISTPSGKGGIAVIRVSGDKAVEICEKVFVPVKGSLSDTHANMAVYGNIYCDGEKVDDGIATVFKSPRSFTGEDTVEISCHGSLAGASMILSALFSNGAVPAEPGEFTKRAFLSGKLTLSKAETIGELIDSESCASQRLSAAKLCGALENKINEISDSILKVLTQVYAYIDYPDEDISNMSDSEMKEHCCDILQKITALSDTYDVGRAITKGISSAIIGAPNVGKSSFLNCILGKERAIVTDIAGTTRDVITETLEIGNIRLVLSDTAGIRDTGDVVEKIGVERSLSELSSAELVFALFDTSRKPRSEDREIIAKLSEYKDTKKIIAILNKNDINEDFSESYKEALSSSGIVRNVSFSAKCGNGKAELEKQIAELYPSSDSEIRSGLIVTGARQYAALQKATEHISLAIKTLETLTPDMCCAELESAVQSLLEIDGRSVNEKIVEGIFSHFCVGK